MARPSCSSARRAPWRGRPCSVCWMCASRGWLFTLRSPARRSRRSPLWRIRSRSTGWEERRYGMSFSRHLLERTHAGRPQPVFTWTESMALPLALSLMEAQPFGLSLAFLTVLFGGTPADAPLSMGELLLLLLGLLWWAMLLAHWQARGQLRSARLRALLRLCGLLVAWGALGVPFLSHLFDLASGPQAFLLGGEFLLAFWFWRRALGRARLGFCYEPLANSFKIGLGALLGLMLLILLTPQASILLAALENSLAIFFLSGLVTLSLTRLGTLRQTRLARGRQAD